MNYRSTTEESLPAPDQPADTLEEKSGVRLPVKVSELRKKLSQKAKQEPKFRFYTLYDRIYRFDVLTAAWWLVLKNNGAPGVDGVTCQDIINGPGATVYLQELHEELKTRSYKPQPVKRVYIPKPDGRQRPLGIPTVRDRIVQMATLLVLEPIFEADFLDSSFGYRPGRSAQQAVDVIREHLKAGYQAVYDADLQAYFDTIPHDQLRKCLEMRITDRTVLHLIWMWLKSPVVEKDKRGRETTSKPKQGTPQGGVISPLLANIYLHWFEVLFHREDGPASWARAKLVRYADDFVILARYQGDRLRNWIESMLEQRFHLQINRKKTRVVNLYEVGASIDFLGFTFRYDRSQFAGSPRYLNVIPSQKSMQRARDCVRELTDSSRGCLPLPHLVPKLNQWIRGWTEYFQHGYPAKAFRHMDRFLRDRLYGFLQRRSQRAFQPPEGLSFSAYLRRLGVQPVGTRPRSLPAHATE